LLSNTARDLDVFVAHHGLDVDAVLTSLVHGKTKPHDSIFRRMLELLDVRPEEALMVGDTSRTTSRAPAPWACRPCCSIAPGATRSHRDGSRT
jgi:Predicted hydrolase (HAD superfamily)